MLAGCATDPLVCDIEQLIVRLQRGEVLADFFLIHSKSYNSRLCTCRRRSNVPVLDVKEARMREEIKARRRDDHRSAENFAVVR
jgi:hypothetical protein